MNKKLRKLFRNPKLFAKDMVENQRRRWKALHVTSEPGHYQYAVITAVYNVEKYLGDFFKSLVKQRLDFKRHIHVILVDDGSTDGSAAIIRQWQKKYPHNITYLYKENGGQASARNVGLSHARAEWVTYVDPDDFLDRDYFWAIDQFAHKHRGKALKMLGTKMVFFHEARNQYADNHPLNYRFAKGDVVCDYQDLGKNVQLSAATAFFRLDALRAQARQFDERIRPNFEDGAFIAAYLADLDEGSVGFTGKAKYYYRKRGDGTSTLDTAWQSLGRFSTVPEYGYLGSMQRYIERMGAVPTYFQRTVLYDIVWNLRHLLNHEERAAFLTDDQRATFLHFLDQIFVHIDEQTILEFELAGCWFYHKVGALHAFKRSVPPFNIAYLEDYDARADQVLVRYFVGEPGLEEFALDGKDRMPAHAKSIEHDFLGRHFVTERRVWLQLEAADTTLSITLKRTPTRISFGGKQHQGPVKVSAIRAHFAAKSVPRHPNGAWIFMDRDVQADDNAEHLYRYVRDHHPEREIYFGLRQTSHDWSRLEADGFNLLAFGSKQYEAALRACDKLISSHADQYVANYFGKGSLDGKHFVFLQHGVTKDDLSNWLNNKEHIDGFVTSSPREYQSIVEDGTRYKFTRKEVALTGFPRHDALIASAQDEMRRRIVIMPTWRKSILGRTTSSMNSDREINADFMRTRYAQAWQGLLNSPRLAELATTHGYEVVFFPHANIQGYLDVFQIPSWVTVLKHEDVSIQPLFREAAMMITDYSSVAFEMAMLERAVIYYQFDRDEFFNGDHAYKKGYFDYEDDGFGPVADTEDQLLDALESVLAAGGQPAPRYLARMREQLPFRDGLSCQRTYEAIVALDGAPSSSLSLEARTAQAAYATEALLWPLSAERWSQVADDSPAGARAKPVERAVHALVMCGRAEDAVQLVQRHEADLSEQPASASNNRCRVMLACAQHRWQDGAANVSADMLVDAAMAPLVWRCLAEAGHSERMAAMLDPCRDRLSPEHATLAQAWLHASRGEWSDVAASLGETIDTWSTSDELRWMPRLLLARAYRMVGDLQQAHAQLTRYRSLGPHDALWMTEAAHVALCMGDRKALIALLAPLFARSPAAIPAELVVGYANALRLAGKNDMALQVLSSAQPEREAEDAARAELAEIHFAQGQWNEVIETVQSMRTAPDALVSKHATALRQLGRMSEALAMLKTEAHTRLLPASDLCLMAEWSEVEGDWQTAVESLQALVTYYPNAAPKDAREALRSARLMLAMEKMKPSANKGESYFVPHFEGPSPYARAEQTGATPRRRAAS